MRFELGNIHVTRSFKRFLKGMRDYLTINQGWSAEEASEYLREPEQFKADWANGLTPAECVANDLETDNASE